MRAKGQCRWLDTNSTSVTPHTRLKPWNPMCVSLYVYLLDDVSLLIKAYQVTAFPWPALRDLCCHTQEIWCQTRNPSAAKHIHSSLASTSARCERLVCISIHTKGRLIYIPLCWLVVAHWSCERLFSELCRLTGLQRKVWSTLLTYFLFLLSNW